MRTPWSPGLGWPDLSTQLYVLAAVTVLVWMLESVFEYVFKILWRNLAQTLQHEVRQDAYDHVQGLELRWFEDRSTGGLMAILNDDVNQLERFLDVGANELLQMLTTVLVIGGIFFTLDPGVAGLAFVPVPLVIWGSFLFQRRIAPRYVDVRERVGLLNGQLSNNLGGIATIKSFTAEAHESQRIERESQAFRAEQQARDRTLVGVLAADSNDHRLRLHGDVGDRWPARLGRNASRRRVQHNGVHDPAPAVAIDAFWA